MTRKGRQRLLFALGMICTSVSPSSPDADYRCLELFDPLRLLRPFSLSLPACLYLPVKNEESGREEERETMERGAKVPPLEGRSVSRLVHFETN